MSDTVGPTRAVQATPGPGPVPPGPVAPPAGGRPAARRAERRAERRAGAPAGRWGGVAELRADLVPALRLTALLLLVGIPAGLLWWLLSPTVHEVVVDGQTIQVESTATERAPAGTVVFTLVMAGVGLLAGLAVWLRRRHRGVTELLGLAAGTLLAGVVAWQLGEALVSWFADPVQTRVGPAEAVLELAAGPALAVGPFVAVLVYVTGALLAAGEDIGRREVGASGAGS